MHRVAFTSDEGGGGGGDASTDRHRVEVDTDIFRVTLRPGGKKEVESGDESGQVRAVCFSRNHDTFAVGGQFDKVALFSSTTGKAQQHSETGKPLELQYGGWVYAAAFSPEEVNLLACGGYDNNVKLFDVTTCEVIHKLRCEDVVRDLCFSQPEGRLLAAAGKDRKVTLFEIESGQTLRRIEQGAESNKGKEVRACAMSPNGHLLASGGLDNKVELHLLRTIDKMTSLGEGGRDVMNSRGMVKVSPRHKVHERGLSVSHSGKLVAALLQEEGMNEYNQDSRWLRLVVYRLGVKAAGARRDALIWEKIYQEGEVNGISFMPSKADSENGKERLYVCGPYADDALVPTTRVGLEQYTLLVHDDELSRPQHPDLRRLLEHGIDAFSFPHAPPPDAPTDYGSFIGATGKDGRQFLFDVRSESKRQYFLPPTGFYWEEVEKSSCVEGRDIKNEKLASALARSLETTLEFTPDEWAQFGIESLNEDQWIVSGARYFKPVDRTSAFESPPGSPETPKRGVYFERNRGTSGTVRTERNDDYLNIVRFAVRRDRASHRGLLLAASDLKRGRLFWLRCASDLRSWRAVGAVKDSRWSKGKSSRAPAIDFSRDGEYLALGWEDCKLRLFNADDGSELLQVDEGSIARAVHLLQGEAIADPPLLASVGRNGQICLRDVGTGAEIKSSDVGEWVTTLSASSDGAVVALGTERSGAKVMNTLLHPLAKRVCAFWAQENVSLPVESGFLSREALLYQTSPSGRTLITHAASVGNLDRLQLLLMSQPLKGLQAQPRDRSIATLLWRDAEGMHALDHALRRRNYQALKMLMEAAVQLPPRARGGLTEPYKSVRDLNKESWTAHLEYYNFLHGLAVAFPDLCARFLKRIDLDEYEDYDGAPTDLRAPEKKLNVELQTAEGVTTAMVALKGYHTHAPKAEMLWPDFKREDDFATDHDCCAADHDDEHDRGDRSAAATKVRVNCQFVGIPGLSGADNNETFDYLARAFAHSGHHKYQAMTSPAMQCTIEYKWNTFARSSWNHEAGIIALYALLFAVAVFFLWGATSDGQLLRGKVLLLCAEMLLMYTIGRNWKSLTAFLSELNKLLQRRAKGLLRESADDVSFLEYGAASFIDVLASITIGVIILSSGGRFVAEEGEGEDLLAAAAIPAATRRHLRGGHGDGDLVDADSDGREYHPESLFSLACCAGTLLLLPRLYYLMRGNRAVSSLLLLLHRIMIDIMPFTIVTAIFILTCGYALALLSVRPSGEGMYNEASFDGFALQVYLTLLGEFQYEEDPTIAKLIVFVLLSFVSNIVLLNALIAIITHSHDEAKKHKAEIRSLLLATVVLEREARIRKDAASKENFPQWVHVLRNESANADGAVPTATKGRVGVLARGVTPGGKGRRAMRQHPPSPFDGGAYVDNTHEILQDSRKTRTEVRELKAKLRTIADNVASTLKWRGRPSIGDDGLLLSGRERMNTMASSIVNPRGGGKRGTIAIDLGTGEMKLIALLYNGEGEVIVKELASTKEVQAKSSEKNTVDIALSYVENVRQRSVSRLRGQSADDVDLTVYQKVVGALKDGLRQLRPDTQDPSYMDDPEKYESSKLFEEERTWETGLIGSTAWYRKLPRSTQESVNQFLQALKEDVETFCNTIGITFDLKIEMIKENDEAIYEQRAVEHACARAKLHAPTATISAGSGSMQFSSTSLNLVASIKTVLQEGVDLVKESKTKAWIEKVQESFDGCSELRKKYESYHTPRNAAAKWLAKRAPSDKFGSGLFSSRDATELHLVGISGLAYAAKAAGLDKLASGLKWRHVGKTPPSKGKALTNDRTKGLETTLRKKRDAPLPPTPPTAASVASPTPLAAAAMEIKFTEAEWKEIGIGELDVHDYIKVDDDYFQAVEKAGYIHLITVLPALLALEEDTSKDAKDRANAMRIRVILSRFLELTEVPGHRAKIMFIRDVDFGPFTKDKPFRTTWTAGWYLNHLRKHKVEVAPFANVH